MPNHIHGIIELMNNDAMAGIENFQPLPQTPKQNAFQKIIPRSIGSIIRGYKIGVTKWFRGNTDVPDVWQRNFHDHIIRNDESYQRIAHYILNNPSKWSDDKFYR